MNSVLSLLPDLRLLIGARFMLRGGEYRVIEVLEAPPALAVESAQPGTTIQPDIHGNPRRHVSHTIIVPVSDSTNQPHEEFVGLLQLIAAANPHLADKIDALNQRARNWTKGDEAS